jgi:hypothetical protein
MFRRSMPVIPAVLAVLFTISAQGQETEAKPAPPPPVPFAVVNVASVERILGDTEFMFKLIDRPDVYDFLKGLLGDRAGDLKGLDRTKPFGVMIFLEDGFPPRPMPVAYVPAANIEELMKTAELGPVKPTKVTDTRYEFIGPGPNKQLVEFRDGFAFITSSEQLIEQEMPDPVNYNQALTSRYDLAVALRIKSVPPILRDVFLGFLRTQTEAEMQRRDGEPEAAYRARRANGISTLGAIEELLTQCDQITIGIDGNQELKKGVLEINVQATPDSAYAKSLSDIAGRPSLFHALQEDADKPLTASISYGMNKREKTVTAEMVEVARISLSSSLTEQNLDPTAVHSLCDVLKATVEGGHFDGFAQVAVPQPGKFIVTAGLQLQGAETASVAVSQLLSEITKLPEVAKNSTLALNQESHQGVAFHRIQPNDEDRGATQFFGSTPAFWFGAGQRALWFAVGADDALPTLKDTMDRVLVSEAPPGGQSIPFVLVFRRAAWMSLTDDSDDPRAISMREIREQAFNTSNDALRVETRPLENGVRTRVEADEGFVRMLGLMLARWYDQSQL